jgi:hypothetical protein
MLMASLFLPFWHLAFGNWAAPVESMGKEVPKGGGDLSDLLKSVTVIVF